MSRIGTRARAARHRPGLGAILLLVGATQIGCLVLPETNRKTLGTHDQMTLEPTGPERVSVSARSDQRRLEVQAVRQFPCVRETTRVTRYRKEKSADLVGPGACNHSACVVVAIALVPVTLVSAVVTGIIVAADRPRVVVNEKMIARREAVCTEPVAATPVRVTIGSWYATRVTDGDGRAWLEIPASLPSAGEGKVQLLGERTVGARFRYVTDSAPPGYRPAR